MRKRWHLAIMIGTYIVTIFFYNILLKGNNNYSAPLGLCPVHAAEWRGEVPACEILNDFEFMKDIYNLRLIRIHILWNKVGTGKEKDFSFYDWYLKKVKEYNFDILCVIGMSQTASVLDMKNLTIKDYGDFVYSVVKRYKDKVKHWEFWNEPRVKSEEDRKAYAELVREGYKMGKKADPTAFFHLGAVVGDLKTGDQHDALYKEFKKYKEKCFDIIDEHPYSGPSKFYAENSMKIFERLLKTARKNKFEQPLWISEVGVKPIGMVFKNKKADRIKALNIVRLITMALNDGAKKFYYWHLRYANQNIPGNCGLIDSAGIRESISSIVFENISKLLNRKIYKTSVTIGDNFFNKNIIAIAFRYSDNNFSLFLWADPEKNINSVCDVKVHVKSLKNKPYLLNLFTGKKNEIEYKISKRGVSLYNLPVSSNGITVVTSLPISNQLVQTGIITNNKKPVFLYRGLFLKGNFSLSQLESMAKYMKAHHLNNVIIKNGALITKSRKIFSKYNISINRIPGDVITLKLDNRCYMYPLQVNCMDCHKINTHYVAKIKSEKKKIYIIEPLFDELDIPVPHMLQEDYKWYKNNNVVGVAITVTPFISTNSINLYFHSVLSYNPYNSFSTILTSYSKRFGKGSKDIALYFKSIEELLARFHNKERILDNFKFNLLNKDSKNIIRSADRKRISIISSTFFKGVKDIKNKELRNFLGEVFQQYNSILNTDLFAANKSVKYPFTISGRNIYEKGFEHLRDVQEAINNDSAIFSFFKENISYLNDTLKKMGRNLNNLKLISPAIYKVDMRRNGIIEHLVLKNGLRTRWVIWVLNNGEWSSHNGVYLSSSIISNNLEVRKEVINTRTLDGFFHLSQIFIIRSDSVTFTCKIKALKSVPNSVSLILNCALPAWPFMGRKSKINIDNKVKNIIMPIPDGGGGELKNIKSLYLKGENNLNINIGCDNGFFNIFPRDRSIQGQMGKRKVYDFQFFPKELPHKKGKSKVFTVYIKVK